jgi:hypothetical protein
VPTVASPQANAIEWQATRLSGTDALAVRASKKLRTDELLLTVFGGTRLRMELDRVPLWRAEGGVSDHVGVKQLAEDFARYLYLPRLQSPQVLVGAVVDGVKLLTWSKDSFAFADSYDEQAARYRALKAGELLDAAGLLSGLVVKSERAERQLDAERKTPGTSPAHPAEAGGQSKGPIDEPGGAATPGAQAVRPLPKRFHATVSIDPARVGRDAGKVAEEVLAHIVGLVGANTRVTIEIEAEIPAGVPENVVRTVSENCRTLKFKSFGFESE